MELLKKDFYLVLPLLLPPFVLCCGSSFAGEPPYLFCQDAMSLQRLRHPHILSVIEAHQHSQRS